jgi:hypothetical protein
MRTVLRESMSRRIIRKEEHLARVEDSCGSFALFQAHLRLLHLAGLTSIAAPHNLKDGRETGDTRQRFGVDGRLARQ